MSSNVIGRFFKKYGEDYPWKEVIKSDISFLKSLSFDIMSSSLNGVDSYYDKELPDDVTYYYEDTFNCYVANTRKNKTLLNEMGFTKKIKNNITIYIKNEKVEGELDSIKVDDTNMLLDILKSDDIPKKYISVYYNEKYTIRGNWYNIDSFISKKAELEARYKECNERYFKIKAIDATLDYFKMDDEQKENYYNEISLIEELIEEYKDSIEACQNMIGILLMVEDSYDADDDDTYKGLPKAAVFIYCD